MMRKTVHRDKNHKQIAEALKQAGMRVFDTAALGDGFPDLVVQRQDGRVFLVEVKSDESTSASKLKNEVEFMMRLCQTTIAFLPIHNLQLKQWAISTRSRRCAAI